jgi:hypothetical protein
MRAASLTRSLGFIVLLATLTSAAIPYGDQPTASGTRANKNTGAAPFSSPSGNKARRLRRAGTNKFTADTISSAANKAHGRYQNVKKTTKSNKALRANVGKQVKKSQSMSSLRKAFVQSGAVQAAEMLRRQWDNIPHDNEDAALRAGGGKQVNTGSDIITRFKAYDTTARRAALKLSPAPDDKCKSLGWALVQLYVDFASGEDVVYNTGCSEDDLWFTGIGFEDDAKPGSSSCQTNPRNADLSPNWAADPKTTSCWSKDDFKHYCSADSTARCALNGTKVLLLSHFWPLYVSVPGSYPSAGLHS